MKKNYKCENCKKENLDNAVIRNGRIYCLKCDYEEETIK